MNTYLHLADEHRRSGVLHTSAAAVAGGVVMAVALRSANSCLAPPLRPHRSPSWLPGRASGAPRVSPAPGRGAAGGARRARGRRAGPMLVALAALGALALATAAAVELRRRNVSSSDAASV